MGFRFYRRIPVSKGTGINVTKSGLSVSHRGKYGSFGTTGFSIRTGIPGLSFRQSWSGAGKGGGLDTLLFLLLFILFVYVAYNLILFVGLVIYNTFALLGDLIGYVYRLARIKMLERKFAKDYAALSDAPNHFFVTFGEPEDERLKGMDFYLEKIVKKTGEYVEDREDCGFLSVIGASCPLQLRRSGIVTWYKLPGQQLFDGDCVARVETAEP